MTVTAFVVLPLVRRDQSAQVRLISRADLPQTHKQLNSKLPWTACTNKPLEKDPKISPTSPISRHLPIFLSLLLPVLMIV